VVLRTGPRSLLFALPLLLPRATNGGRFARCLVVFALAIVLALATLASSARAASDLLPDLRMPRLTDLKIERTSDGRKLLRFSSIIVNVGDGPLRVHGQRPDTGAPTMTTFQRIFDEAGETRDVPTDAVMHFGGDGHNHWHVRDLESFELERLRNGSKVGAGAKHGFCFWDNHRYGSGQDPYYTGCGQWTDLEVTMGLSVGWGDLYRYNLPDQYIDITGLGRGRYRLVGTADAENCFRESEESNNSTWVDLRIRNGRATVVGYGPTT
jgi:hypothetical protein